MASILTLTLRYIEQDSDAVPFGAQPRAVVKPKKQRTTRTFDPTTGERVQLPLSSFGGFDNQSNNSDNNAINPFRAHPPPSRGFGEPNQAIAFGNSSNDEENENNNNNNNNTGWGKYDEADTTSKNNHNENEGGWGSASDEASAFSSRPAFGATSTAPSTNNNNAQSAFGWGAVEQSNNDDEHENTNEPRSFGGRGGFGGGFAVPSANIPPGGSSFGRFGSAAPPSFGNNNNNNNVRNEAFPTKSSINQTNCTVGAILACSLGMLNVVGPRSMGNPSRIDIINLVRHHSDAFKFTSTIHFHELGTIDASFLDATLQKAPYIHKIVFGEGISVGVWGSSFIAAALCLRCRELEVLDLSVAFKEFDKFYSRPNRAPPPFGGDFGNGVASSSLNPFEICAGIVQHHPSELARRGAAIACFARNHPSWNNTLLHQICGGVGRLGSLSREASDARAAAAVKFLIRNDYNPNHAIHWEDEVIDDEEKEEEIRNRAAGAFGGMGRGGFGGGGRGGGGDDDEDEDESPQKKAEKKKKKEEAEKKKQDREAARELKRSLRETPLVAAVTINAPLCAIALLEAGASHLCYNRDLHGLVDIAVANGSLECLRVLVERNLFDPAQPVADFENFLSPEFVPDRVVMAERAVEINDRRNGGGAGGGWGRPPHVSVEDLTKQLQPKKRQTALTIACLLGQVEILKYLFSFPSVGERFKIHNRAKIVQERDEQTARYQELLQQYKDEHGAAALHRAALPPAGGGGGWGMATSAPAAPAADPELEKIESQFDIARFKKDDPLDLQHEEPSPWIAAATASQTDVIRILLDADFDVLYKNPDNSNTLDFVLSSKETSKDPQVVKALLAKGIHNIDNNNNSNEKDLDKNSATAKIERAAEHFDKIATSMISGNPRIHKTYAKFIAKARSLAPPVPTGPFGAPPAALPPTNNNIANGRDKKKNKKNDNTKKGNADDDEDDEYASDKKKKNSSVLSSSDDDDDDDDDDDEDDEFLQNEGSTASSATFMISPLHTLCLVAGNGGNSSGWGFRNRGGDGQNDEAPPGVEALIEAGFSEDACTLPLPPLMSRFNDIKTHIGFAHENALRHRLGGGGGGFGGGGGGWGGARHNNQHRVLNMNSRTRNDDADPIKKEEDIDLSDPNLFYIPEHLTQDDIEDIFSNFQYGGGRSSSANGSISDRTLCELLFSTCQATTQIGRDERHFGYGGSARELTVGVLNNLYRNKLLSISRTISPLAIAVWFNSLGTVKALLESGRFDIHRPVRLFSRQKSLLELAIMGENQPSSAMVQLLLKHYEEHPQKDSKYFDLAWKEYYALNGTRNHPNLFHCFIHSVDQDPTGTDSAVVCNLVADALRKGVLTPDEADINGVSDNDLATPLLGFLARGVDLNRSFALIKALLSVPGIKVNHSGWEKRVERLAEKYTRHITNSIVDAHFARVPLSETSRCAEPFGLPFDEHNREDIDSAVFSWIQNPDVLDKPVNMVPMSLVVHQFAGGDRLPAEAKELLKMMLDLGCASESAETQLMARQMFFRSVASGEIDVVSSLIQNGVGPVFPEADDFIQDRRKKHRLRVNAAIAEGRRLSEEKTKKSPSTQQQQQHQHQHQSHSRSPFGGGFGVPFGSSGNQFEFLPDSFDTTFDVGVSSRGWGVPAVALHMGQTALDVALGSHLARWGSVQGRRMIELLMKSGCDVRQPVNASSGATVLHRTLESDPTSLAAGIIRVIITAGGADPNAADKFGESPLNYLFCHAGSVINTHAPNSTPFEGGEAGNSSSRGGGGGFSSWATKSTSRKLGGAFANVMGTLGFPDASSANADRASELAKILAKISDLVSELKGLGAKNFKIDDSLEVIDVAELLESCRVLDENDNNNNNNNNKNITVENILHELEGWLEHDQRQIDVFGSQDPVSRQFSALHQHIRSVRDKANNKNKAGSKKSVNAHSFNIKFPAGVSTSCASCSRQIMFRKTVAGEVKDEDRIRTCGDFDTDNTFGDEQNNKNLKKKMNGGENEYSDYDSDNDQDEQNKNQPESNNNNNNNSNDDDHERLQQSSKDEANRAKRMSEIYQYHTQVVASYSRPRPYLVHRQIRGEAKRCGLCRAIYCEECAPKRKLSSNNNNNNEVSICEFCKYFVA